MTIALDTADRPRPSTSRSRSCAARLTGSVHTPGDPSYAALSSPWNLAVPMRPAAVVAVRTAEDVVDHRPLRRRARLHRRRAGHRPRRRELARRTPARRHQGPRRGDRAPRGLGPRRRRREVAAGHRGGRAVRAGPAQRLHQRRRRRRLHDRRRRRPDGPHLRPRRRPGARVRGRHRRRRAAPGHARPSTPTCSSPCAAARARPGIVTAVEFDLVHLPTFYGGAVYFDGADAAAVIDRWRDWSDDAARAGDDVVRAVPAAPDARASRRRWPAG